MLQENIIIGQRIENFHLEYWNGKQWSTFAEATTIGYKRLLRFPEVTARRLKIVIDECRTEPTLSSFGIFEAPPEVRFEPEGCAFSDSINFKLASDTKNVTFFYTLDGSIPDGNSLRYTGDILLNKTTTVTAIAISANGKKSIPIKANYNKAKYSIKLKTIYSPKYTGGGNYALVDGVFGSTNFNDGRWQGYHGSDINIIIDLGEVKRIKNITARFLHNINAYIFLPKDVEFSVSNDGDNFVMMNKLINDTPQNDNNLFIKTFEYKPENISGRFIHFKAANIGTCPPWHPGAGDKAWLFADEITVE